MQPTSDAIARDREQVYLTSDGLEEVEAKSVGAELELLTGDACLKLMISEDFLADVSPGRSAWFYSSARLCSPRAASPADSVHQFILGRPQGCDYDPAVEKPDDLPAEFRARSRTPNFQRKRPRQNRWGLLMRCLAVTRLCIRCR